MAELETSQNARIAELAARLEAETAARRELEERLRRLASPGGAGVPPA